MALIKCKECGNEVSTEALSCPKCGALISKKNKSRPGCLVIVFAVVAALFIVNLLGGQSKSLNLPTSVSDAGSETTVNNKPEVSNPKLSEPVSANPAPAPAPDNWAKGSVKDEMTDQEKPFLTSTSINGADFNFPYHVDGGSRASIVIRRDGKRKVAYIIMQKGHIICSYDNCTIQTRSASGKIQNWSASEASPGVNNAIFINNVNAFENYISHNKKIRVGIEFYEYGVRSFDFNVSGYPGI